MDTFTPSLSPIEEKEPSQPTNQPRKAIIKKGPRETTPKTYPVVSPKLPFSELPRIFTQKTGIPAYFEPITLDEWGSTVAQAAGKGYETDIRQMMEWIAVAPDEKVCYGTMEPEMLHRAWEELGVRASSLDRKSVV